ncbi:MAG TPA: ABC transporter ATP-binding protein [bacterium]|nr:ABC transporter ATP-binding protein [bacterium]
MARLSLNHLTKRFGSYAAVHDVSLEVHDGELMCLLGPSGCGKTTTLRMIGGFITPDAGDIQIDRRSVLGMPPERRPTAMVFQRYNLWPHMTVENNIAFGLKIRRLGRAEIERKVHDALSLVGLPNAGRKHPHELSGGEQQRIAVARVLVLEPQILLLDEPFSNLDARLRVHMREEVKQLQRKVGITTVFVTHDQEEALTIADRIAVMQQGVLEQVDTPAALYATPRTLFVADFIGTMNLIPGRMHAQAAGTVITAGPWRLAADRRWPEDSEVTVAVRPEDLVLAPDGIPVEVRRVINLGHYLQVLLDAPSVGILRMFASKGERLAEGQRVPVGIARALVFHGPEVVEIGGPMQPTMPSPADRR